MQGTSIKRESLKYMFQSPCNYSLHSYEVEITSKYCELTDNLDHFQN